MRVEPGVAEPGVELLLGGGTDAVATLRVVEQMLYGIGERAVVVGRHEDSGATVFHIFVLCAICGGDVGLAKHHIFEIGETRSGRQRAESCGKHKMWSDI